MMASTARAALASLALLALVAAPPARAADAGAGCIGVVADTPFLTRGIVQEVLPDGPAWQAGVRPGDRVEALDGDRRFGIRPPMDDGRDWQLVGTLDRAVRAEAAGRWLGAVGTSVSLAVRGKGTLVVRRGWYRTDVLAALARARAAAIAEAERRIAAGEVRRRAASRALADAAPAWPPAGWKRGAGLVAPAFRAYLAAKPGDAAARGLAAAIAAGRPAAVVAARATARRLADAPLGDPALFPFAMALPDLVRLAGTAEVWRLGGGGDLAGARQALEAAEDPSEMGSSSEDPDAAARVRAAAAALGTVTEAEGAAAAARSDLEALRAREALGAVI